MDITSLEHEQQQLRDDLMSLIDNLNQDNKHQNTFNHSLKSFDFIITHCEVNDLQGVGVLVKRIFADSSQVVSLRSHNLYEGQQSFGESHYCLSYQKSSRAEILETVSQTFSHKKPKRILCIPYYPDDMLTAIALKDIFKVPLCTYIMDDQNIYVNNISDELTRELIGKSDFCLGISRDLCKAYQQKYQKKFWFLPPVAPQSLIAQSQRPDSTLTNSKKGIIVGNIWSQKWLDRLLKITAQSDIEIDWYANPNRDWLKFDDQELSRSGIHLKGYLSETQLAPTLKKAAFALIPTAASDDISERVEIAKLSLPSRIPFIVATSHTPLIVMGSPDTAAAHFVESFKLGKVCGYDPESFNKAVSWITLPENQEDLRQKAADLAPKLSCEGVAEWIWQSLAQGKPIDLRFENLGTTLSQATVIITLNEVNQQHGTGALVRRIVGDTPNILSIRSESHYGGKHDFGEVSLCLPKTPITRIEAYEFIQEHLKGSSVKQILCVPYHPDEVRLAIAVKDLYDVPLATYIMDDQNIVVNNIPDDLMREFLTKCSLRFATHPELRDAYENKYSLKFWLLPAIAPSRYVNTAITFPKPDKIQAKTGALMGSIWSESWFEMLCDTIKGANVKLDWFGNATYWWLQQSPQEMAQTRGINPFGVLAEQELAETLKDYPYVIVPTGTLDERDDRQELSQLSLPGRIIFALVSSNTPIIILGSEKTGAAHFVQRFGIGLTCDYDAQAFRKAVDHITQPDIQKEMRHNAAQVAENFSDKDIKDWLWQSLHNSQPVDSRFEDLLPRTEDDIARYVEVPVLNDIHKDYVPVYHVMRRLCNKGYCPDFIVDVGSSQGMWSHTTSRLFADARFILIDPLMSKHQQVAKDFYLQQIPNATLLEVTVSNESGTTTFQVSPDLYGSSLLNPADYRTDDTVTVDVLTLDKIAKTYQLTGRGMLKLDVQCAEHIVLEGAKQLLEQVDAIVVELSLVRYDANALVLTEMLNLLDELGFRYYDEAGDWRSPVDGTLLQKEIVFLRHNLLVFQTSSH